MKRILIVAVIMAMLMSGCSVMMSTMEQGATQPTVEEMLAQALRAKQCGQLRGGHTAVRGDHRDRAQQLRGWVRPGHAYRSVGRTMDAISILKKAAKLSTE